MNAKQYKFLAVVIVTALFYVAVMDSSVVSSDITIDFPATKALRN